MEIRSWNKLLRYLQVGDYNEEYGKFLVKLGKKTGQVAVCEAGCTFSCSGDLLSKDGEYDEMLEKNGFARIVQLLREHGFRTRPVSVSKTTEPYMPHLQYSPSVPHERTIYNLFVSGTEDSPHSPLNDSPCRQFEIRVAWCPAQNSYVRESIDGTAMLRDNTRIGAMYGREAIFGIAIDGSMTRKCPVMHSMDDLYTAMFNFFERDCDADDQRYDIPETRSNEELAATRQRLGNEYAVSRDLLDTM